MDVLPETTLPPVPLETSHTVFDSANDPETLFILQTLNYVFCTNVLYKTPKVHYYFAGCVAWLN
jgi:hypothetical protein